MIWPILALLLCAATFGIGHFVGVFVSKRMPTEAEECEEEEEE